VQDTPAPTDVDTTPEALPPAVPPAPGPEIPAVEPTPVVGEASGTLAPDFDPSRWTLGWVSDTVDSVPDHNGDSHKIHVTRMGLVPK
jgi:hypothetical protein